MHSLQEFAGIQTHCGCLCVFHQHPTTVELRKETSLMSAVLEEKTPKQNGGKPELQMKTTPSIDSNFVEQETALMVPNPERTQHVTLEATFSVRTVRSVGCFVCSSFNHSNPACEDPFHNRNNQFYHSKCWASHRNRIGVYPATQCIKMVATDYETGYHIVVRNCVVDNGGTTSESEIGRQSHCGWVRAMKYNNKMYRGCILACDYDGLDSHYSNVGKVDSHYSNVGKVDSHYSNVGKVDSHYSNVGKVDSHYNCVMYFPESL
ncbi:Hypothetical predicted protein [Octopus vulgaris]|uniref:Uncharacterized protein n=1 Tax=Octopus vulgaris TaxID=6645 RepID=A0AA36FB57_OCTVU|nr:Hypothetical predicted protein [Octopus vulgaris]